VKLGVRGLTKGGIGEHSGQTDVPVMMGAAAAKAAKRLTTKTDFILLERGGWQQ
jgi:hypothetical protein